jgi:hypothetical protein
LMYSNNVATVQPPSSGILLVDTHGIMKRGLLERYS